MIIHSVWKELHSNTDFTVTVTEYRSGIHTVPIIPHFSGLRQRPERQRRLHPGGRGGRRRARVGRRAPGAGAAAGRHVLPRQEATDHG